MAEGTTKLISEEKGDVLKPNFEVEDLKKIVKENLKKIVKENSTKNLENFIKGECIAVKTKKSIVMKPKKDEYVSKKDEKVIDIGMFKELDYLNFTLILTAINVGEATQMHLRPQSMVIVIKEKEKSSISKNKQKLLNALFDKYCTTYNLEKIKNYIKSEKSYKESESEKRSLEEEYKKAKEELSEQKRIINSIIILLTLLEIIDCLDMGFKGFKVNFKNFIGLRVITKFDATYFKNIEENSKKISLNLMIQILKDCLSNVYKLEKEEFLDFLEFIIDNFDFINNSDYMKHFSDIQNLTSNILNYFLNVSVCESEFTENFVEKLKEILLKIKKPKINFGDILSRLNGYKKM